MFKNKNFFSIIIEIALLPVCIYGVYKSFWMNTVGVSFWLDEAMLAFSFSKRSIWTLTSSIFEWNQIAPVGWLYVNKIISILFGNTEFTLRLFSIFSFAITIFLIYHISNRYFHLRLPLLGSAYIASLSFALQYSIMFKPYISDGMFAMITIVAYLRYKERANREGSNLYLKMANHSGIDRRTWFLGILWAVLVWFSNPVCFVAGGLILSEMLFTLIQGIRKILKVGFQKSAFIMQLKPWILIGAILTISFVLYYFYWLSEVANGAPMQDFWAGMNYPLIPKSVKDLSRIQSMKSHIFSHFSFLEPVMTFGLIVTLIYGVYRKSRCIIGLYLGFLIMLFASYINMFPVQDRIWYYFYPLATLLFFIGVDNLFHFLHEKKGFASTLVLGILGIFVIICNDGFKQYSSKDLVYRAGEETNYEVDYVKDHINDDEKVYVYYHSVPGFQYRNGYDTSSIGEFRENIIYGSGFLLENEESTGEEISRIANAHNCYIVMSHWNDDRIFGIKHILPQLGWLELVRNDYSTPLLYWTDDIEKTKSRVELTTIQRDETDGIIHETIRIKNTGETILNSEFNPVRLVSEKDGISEDILGEIAQGANVDVKVEYFAKYSPVFRLVDISGKDICMDTIE